MDRCPREAWTRIVLADDLDAHMAAVGQAQANAALVETMMTAKEVPERKTVLVAGAGTGQMFDYVNDSFLAPYHVTFTDINGAFLDRLRERLAGASLSYETVVDDIEDSKLSGPFGMAVVINADCRCP
jgi:ubiquinone/menaquinone biosynthesis C-methylase UbiE